MLHHRFLMSVSRHPSILRDFLSSLAPDSGLRWRCCDVAINFVAGLLIARWRVLWFGNGRFYLVIDEFVTVDNRMVAARCTGVNFWRLFIFWFVVVGSCVISLPVDRVVPSHNGPHRFVIFVRWVDVLHLFDWARGIWLINRCSRPTPWVHPQIILNNSPFREVGQGASLNNIFPLPIHVHPIIAGFFEMLNSLLKYLLFSHQLGHFRIRVFASKFF